ncbi:MAG: class I SAM-dependent methyltransferase [Cytophagales bacterium]|nr:class I SAM-dependent methyltransferase [Cytophagales bacterium]
MLVDLQECPICKGKDFNPYKKCKDFTVSGETFSIITCKYCGFKFTNPRPDESQLMKYYESSQYISHNNRSNSLINFVYKNVRKVTVRQKAKLLAKFVKKGYMMDYGCGTGEFLKACQDRGWHIDGVEPAQKAREQALQLTGARISGSIFDVDENEQQYDAITMWHVLEHIPQLDKTFMKIKQMLKRKGKIIIAVPNHTSPDAKMYDNFWAGYDVPRHLYHFDKNSLSGLLSKYNFEIETIIPQKLDAYYVSLLSEKNKNNHTNMLKAIVNGYRSNQQAKKEKQNYSSLIYVAKYD